jgi:ribosome-associated heat shock protein Hsp15
MENKKARLDKWLWSIRMFKSRSLATAACQRGRVKINKRSTKPSSTVMEGDIVEVEKNRINYTYKVLQVIEQRVGYKVAVECYEDLTPQEEKDKFKEQFVIRHKGEFREQGVGRPTKRDRRDIDSFKDIDIDFEDYFDDE